MPLKNAVRAFFPGPRRADNNALLTCVHPYLPGTTGPAHIGVHPLFCDESGDRSMRLLVGGGEVDELRAGNVLVGIPMLDEDRGEPLRSISLVVLM